MTDDERMTEAIALHVFEQGFLAGANPLRARKGHTVDPATHMHWKAGFEAGREAAKAARASYAARASQSKDPRKATR